LRRFRERGPRLRADVVGIEGIARWAGGGRVLPAVRKVDRLDLPAADELAQGVLGARTCRPTRTRRMRRSAISPRGKRSHVRRKAPGISRVRACDNPSRV
jgi:hypothetical protein